MKLNITQKAIVKEFESDIKDKELQKRYDVFVSNKKHLLSRFTPLKDEYNSLVESRDKIEKLVIGLVKTNQIIAVETVAHLNNLDKELDDRYKCLMELQRMISEEDILIKKYEDFSERKLRDYWNIMKVTGIINDYLPDWSRKYKGVIF